MTSPSNPTSDTYRAQRSWEDLASEFFTLGILGYLTAGGASTSTVDILDRAARVLGHVQVDNQVSTDIIDRAARLLGHVTVDSSPALTDTQLRATPVGVNAKGLFNSSAPTPVASGQSVDLWADAFGRLNAALHSAELNTSVAVTSLRDLQIAQRYSVLFDSIADGFAPFWTLSSNGSGSNPAVAVGEGTLNPGAGASGYSQMTSVMSRYLPGQSAWLNSAIRAEAGIAGNTRRWGAFSISGTAPQDGFAFELIDTTLYATIYKNGSVVDSQPTTSWSRFAVSPFTMNTNYHAFEIRWTANGVQFYVDNVVKHVYAGTTTAITSTLNFPMTLQNINTTGLVTGPLLAIRNIGIGRFGNPPWEYTNGTPLPDQNGAGGVLTFTFPSPVDLVWVTDISTSTTAITRVDPYGGTPSSSQGAVVLNQIPTPIQVLPPASSIKVFAPTGTIISVRGDRYV